MGINGLSKFLRTQCPHVFQPVHLSHFRYKKVAVDVSLFMCKYKFACRDEWLTGFLRLVQALRENDVHCVFVYDSKAPAEKDKEREDRAERRRRNEDNIASLEADFDRYISTGTISPGLINLQNKLHKTTKRKFHSLLAPESKETIVAFEPDLVAEAVNNMRAGLIHISSDDFVLTKKLCKALNVPVLQAPMEAEATCADLSKRGLVDAVLTEDTDVLAYGAPVFLSKIDVFNQTCVQIEYENVLSCLELSSQSFLDFCVMCGCDYNNNIPKIGPVTAYKLVKKHSTIESVQSEAGKDITCLKHVRTRELFTSPTVASIDKIAYCGRPDYEAVRELIPDIDVEKLRRSFEPKIRFSGGSPRASH